MGYNYTYGQYARTVYAIDNNGIILGDDAGLGLTIADGGNATFSQDLTVTGGTINIGADCNLYRDSANTLKTDDNLT